MLITIITACLNNVAGLKKTIASLVAQNYQNYQYIVIDGASMDGTVDVLREYSSLIDYWVSEPDAGLADAWNKGLSFASGEVVYFLNAGDCLEEKSLNEISKAFTDPDVFITYGITKFCDDGVVKQMYRGNFRPERIKITFGFMHTSCCVRKTVFDHVGNFDTTVSIAVDTDFLLRCFVSNYTFTKTDFTVRMEVGGMSDRYWIKANREYVDLLEKYNLVKFPILYKTILYPRYLIRNNKETIIKVALQINFILIAFVNLLLAYMPLFCLRAILLRLMGAKIGKGVAIHRRTKIFSLGNLEIGDHSVINNGTFLDNRRKIKIGSNVSIAHECRIYTLGHDIDDELFSTKGASVEIGDYSCLFVGSKIMPGVVLGTGTVVYPGAVVARSSAPADVLSGIPAKVVRKRRGEQQYTLDYRFWLGL